MNQPVFRTRENDPQIAAKRLVQPGETLLPCRGDHVSGEATGPAVRIMRDNAVRLLVVSERGGHGFDD